MLFWLIVVAVVAFSWGFAAGATHEQYKPITGGKAIRYPPGSNPPAPKGPRPAPSPNPPKAPIQTIRIITR